MRKNKKTLSTGTAEEKQTYTLEDILGKSMSREEALDFIRSDAEAEGIFSSFEPSEKEKVLTFVQGNRGLYIMHDTFVKKVLDPDLHKDRLEGFLSEVLGEPVTIVEALKREGSQMSDQGSLVIMDFLCVSNLYIGKGTSDRARARNYRETEKV
ncbi:MAG: hypothetical protein LUI02_00030 [Clostridiales bacterium]|nr:hypothetical protein [Clostridiales bacterium]